MRTCELETPILITGPCGPASKEDMVLAAQAAKARNIQIVRGSVDKPRTEPGWDGLHDEGITGLIEVAKMGLIPATEVLSAQRATNIIEALAKEVQKPRLLLWLGSRNQNHEVQIEIARVAGSVDWTLLMFKNQMWRDERHWKGIFRHLTEGAGFDKSRLLTCHRGFDPGTDYPRDEDTLRNNPDYEMAMRIKEMLGIPTLVDTSHIGGNVENVEKITMEAFSHRSNGVGFDGGMFEVSDADPAKIITDAKQHLTWRRFDALVPHIRPVLSFV